MDRSQELDIPGKSQRSDNWVQGESYEPYVGRWSRLVAHEFLRWLAVPRGAIWLDVGCGTGALTESILKTASPAQTFGIDSSPGFVGYAKGHVLDSRANFCVGDATALPVRGASVDAAVSGLVLNFVPAPLQFVAEMARAVRPTGIVAAYVWDYAGDMQLMRYFWDAAVELNPAASLLDEGPRFPICRPEPLTDLFRASGLGSVETCAIDVPTVFRDFDDYWSPFLGGQGPAPNYATSLPEAELRSLRELLNARLPRLPDGSIALTARAWAVRGTKAAA